MQAGRGSEQWRGLTAREWFQQAQDVGGRDGRRFFHWELEFPQAFFQVQQGGADWKPQDERGFDAVIGSPPYLSIEALAPDERPALFSMYPVAARRFDAYALFLYMAGRQLITPSGRVGPIVPTTLFDNLSYARFREWLSGSGAVHHVRGIGDEVFEDAKNDCCVSVLFGGEADEAIVRDTSCGRSTESDLPPRTVPLPMRYFGRSTQPWAEG